LRTKDATYGPFGPVRTKGENVLAKRTKQVHHNAWIIETGARLVAFPHGQWPLDMQLRRHMMAGVVVDMKMKSDDKNKALEAAIGQIEKAFGKGSVMKLGQRESAVDVQAISTGSLGLDIGLGIGGFPKGRIVEVYGPESSGKTTLALHAVAEAQKEGGTCAFVDAEHALDPVYARKLGVNIDDLLISQPDAGEQALEIADTLVRSGAIDVLVVDSVAALVPRAELEGEMGDHHVGLHARLMSQALRKLTSSIARSNCLVIFINQIRLKIGVMFGNPETTTGGNALKFYASVRLDIRRIGAIKDRDEVVGNQTRVKVVKNKVAAPFRTIEFDIMYGEGISKMGELLDLGVAAGIVDKSGAWISYNGQRIGQGRENAKTFLRENPEIADEIEAAIRQNAGLVGDQMLDNSIADTAEAVVPDSPDLPESDAS
jgi:recombination protein RecA